VSTQFQWPVRVYYEDTDAGGVVYHARYLHFFERGRSEWLRALGFEQDEMVERDGVIFAVRRAEVDFIAPARFNDALRVVSEVQERRRASLTFRQEIRRGGDDRLLCAARIQVACLDARRLRPCPMPQALLQEMSREF
jgi:acyl-CoA thioester hydrolase